MDNNDYYDGKNEEEDYDDPVEQDIARRIFNLDIDPYEQELAETFNRLSVYSPPYPTSMDCNTRSPPRRINQYRLPPRRAQNQQPPPSSTRANYISREPDPENAHLFYELEQIRRGPVVGMEEVYTPELINFILYRQTYLPIVNDIIINRRINFDVRTHTQYGQEVHKEFIRDFNPLIFRQSNIGEDIKFRIEQLYQRLLDNISTDYNHDYNITKDKDYFLFCQELMTHIL
jgi:hypothetical protein